MRNRFAFSVDGGLTYDNDIFDSVDEIMRLVKSEYPEVKEIWIGKIVDAELIWETNEEYIIDSIFSNLYDKCGDGADSFGVTVDIEEDLGKMIDETVKNWIKKHNLKSNCYTVSNPELYEV